MSEPVRTAIVTGSTQGLGRAMAERLLADGARVAVTGRSAARAASVASELDPSGEQALGVGLDVRSREQFVAALATVTERWGGVDVLINNAGVTARTPFADLTDSEWDDVLAINLRSVFIACQLVAPAMRDRGWGRIVNHASLAGQQGGLVTGPHYAAAKAGIVVLTKVIAAELAPYGVTVNAIAPAATDSPPMHELPAEDFASLPQRIPVGRVGRPEEVAALVAFLASEQAGFVTGATYDINGGLFMR
jgi:3-oxoacyl-[acyl-carrier protein] reductase